MSAHTEYNLTIYWDGNRLRLLNGTPEVHGLTAHVVHDFDLDGDVSHIWLVGCDLTEGQIRYLSVKWLHENFPPGSE